jgi:hypothetical protein
MHEAVISFGAQPRLQATNVPVGQAQTPRRFDLLQMTLLHFVQYLESISFSRAQFDSLRFHPASLLG